MPFQKIEPDRVAESVITQIEQLILRGIIRPGEQIGRASCRERV